MRNKISILLLILSSFMFINTAKAESGNGDEYKSYYDKGIQSVTIRTPQWVTLYGKSICNGRTCQVEYAGQTSNFEEVLKKSVVCANGEQYITYQVGGSGKTGTYDSTQSENGFSGTMYWAEEYYVTCTSSNTGNNVLKPEVNNGGATNNGSSNTGNSNEGSSNSGSINNGSSNNGTSNGGSSNSGSTNDGTVQNPETGVNTYFIILGVVALVSYACTMFVKKLNLFKNI